MWSVVGYMPNGNYFAIFTLEKDVCSPDSAVNDKYTSSEV